MEHHDKITFHSRLGMPWQYDIKHLEAEAKIRCLIHLWNMELVLN